MTAPAQKPEVAVLGAGVIGLTCARRLLVDGWRVVIYACEQTPHTTSDIAAAFWFPYQVAGARVRDWSHQTRQVYVDAVACGVPGLALAPLVVLQCGPVPRLDVSADADGAVPIADGDLPAGFSQGLRLEVPRIEAPAYLPWLQSDVLQHGGRIQRCEVRAAEELLERHPIVVNCSGLGARSAVPDPTVFPIRGQVVRIARPMGLPPTIFLHEEADVLTYVVPRSSDCVLGGTAQPNDWNREPDAATADAILERCRQLCPGLAGAPILAHRVGLRPGRPEVRLETEHWSGGRALIHNYGHGGAGFTLAWGCADEVASRVRACIDPAKAPTQSFEL